MMRTEQIPSIQNPLDVRKCKLLCVLMVQSFFFKSIGVLVLALMLLSNVGRLEWNVAMLLPWILQLLHLQYF